MKLFTALCCFISIAHAATDYRELKNGFTFGAGLNVGVYSYLSQFDGAKKNKLDATTTIVGPSINIGYDRMLSDHFLLGLRLEGMTADTAGMNEHKSKKTFERTSGKTNQIFASLRAGYVRELVGKNPVENPYRMIVEYFLEAGLGTGKSHYDKQFSYNDGTVNESYKDELSETFNSGVIAIGANITSGSGSFCELKLIEMRAISNKARYRGEQSVNNGSLQAISKNLTDTHPDPVHSIVLLIGRHY